MSDDKTSVWNNSTALQFAEVMASIDDLATMANFLRDILTEKEITEISARLEAARMLEAKKTYSEIVKQTKLSSRTVARISEWMKNGCSGYAAALNQIHTIHMAPAHTG